MTNNVMSLESSFTDQVSAAYLSRSWKPSQHQLTQWRYRHVLPLLHRLHGPVSGFHLHEKIIQGERLVWLEGGNRQGESLLLLHGFGACKENWLPILPFLAKRYHLVLPDLPGWGQSAFRAGTDYSLDAQVERLNTWAQQVIKQPAHLVGSSLGGAVAGLFAARHPDLFTSLTLMNAAGVVGEKYSPFEAGLLQGENGLLAKNTYEVVQLLAGTMRSRLLPWLMAPFASHDLVSRHAVNQHLFRQLLDKPPAPDLPSYSAIQLPTLILWGEADTVIHPSCADTYKQLIPNAKVEIINGVGHMPMVEAPRQTSRELTTFWQAC